MITGLSIEYHGWIGHSGRLTLCAALEREKAVDRRAVNTLVSLEGPQLNQESR